MTLDYSTMLDAAHELAAPGAVVVGPHGYAYASPERLSVTTRWIAAKDGSVLECTGKDEFAHPVTDGLGVSCVRISARAAHRGEPSSFGHRLLGAHVDLLDNVVAHTIDDLAARTAEGSTLLGRQLVQAAIADAVVLVDEVRGMAGGAAMDRHVRARTFHCLVRGGRDLLRLLGAAGFLAGGPGGALLTAELAGTLYLGAGHD
ncbi:hypothetical protein SAMN05421504_101760 [Amycolatopsis xylanica]|uniref:Acyl-CoA dehydrogenase, C-terminal domain n=1 Tax=Amycolatopsis xylanica TaxID=589385 RepID=A0A1H2U2B0_9PSEU|nr:hypothetical protein [Amycolatopsis xylanica]SDW50137.1 hypothetical protein SAMN05421504_101760 [Amycolatopsis xylanica]